jgi:hypothetical protein
MRYGPEQDNITQIYRIVEESTGGCRHTYFRFARTSVRLTTAFMTPAARSHSLSDSVAVIARRFLGLSSTNSCPRRRRGSVIDTSTSPTISCSTLSSPAISNDSGSRGAGVVGFGAFRVVDDWRGVGGYSDHLDQCCYPPSLIRHTQPSAARRITNPRTRRGRRPAPQTRPWCGRCHAGRIGATRIMCQVAGGWEWYQFR